MLILVIGAAIFVALGWKPAIAPVDRPQASAFKPEVLSRGAQLAALGDCTVCHTAPGGRPFAGGLAVETPFGTIHSTDITPDPETGIGRWSEAAFKRAMREGVSRDGHHLYPAFPYDHFTRTKDEDISAIYAFLMTRQPVSAKAPANDLPFPLNVRFILTGWNLLFLHRDPVADDPSQPEAWNRGKYLVESLGHCGACHTPRNALGAEKRAHAFAGGVADRWTAPALDGASPAPVPWTQESLFTYLKTGFETQHSFAAGPMAPVVSDLRAVSDDDVQAISVYIASLMGPVPPPRQQEGQRAVEMATQAGLGFTRGAPDQSRDEPGAALYASACGWCHYNADSKGSSFASRQKLGLGSVSSMPDPSNLIHVILEGIPPVEGEATPIMPGFAGSFTDRQVADLANYARAHFSTRPAWKNVDDAVKAIRSGKDIDRSASRP